MKASTTYSVKGMTCGHCVRAVHDEVSAVAGVTEVEVDLAAGELTVDWEGPADDDAVRAGVEEAGYQVAAR